MTNKGINLEDHPENLRLADLLAMNVVTEVIDEAYILANAALESGAPYAYLEIVKNLRNEMKLDRTLTDEINMECNGILAATSTPQKDPSKSKSPNPQIDSGYIGQGDEGSFMLQDDMRNCTSSLINHLFDMSEVEGVIICDGPEYSAQQYPTPVDDPNDILQQTLTKIADAFMNDSLIPIPENIFDTYEEAKVEEIIGESSEYLLRDNANTADGLTVDIPYCIHGDSNIKGFDNIQIFAQEKLENNYKNTDNEQVNDVAYENAYLSLNRDYEQASEDCYPVIEDPKCTTLQDVELLKNSEIDLNSDPDTEKLFQEKELVPESTVFATGSGSRKSLVRRCRLQGARILACLRGWWRRKAHGRRKDCRGSGSVRGVCPLSPGLRSRTTSLMDERKKSPSASKHSFRKFNTISEAVVKSCIWKDYKFDYYLTKKN